MKDFGNLCAESTTTGPMIILRRPDLWGFFARGDYGIHLKDKRKEMI